MPDTRTTLPKQIEALQKKADKLEDHARKNGLLPAKVDDAAGVGRVTGLVP